MSRSGPITKDTSTIALGMAQVRVGNSAANISSTDAVLTASNSIGSLAQSNVMAPVEYWTLEGGFPLVEEVVLPLREKASAEVTFREITAYNFALARGLDPTNSVDASVPSAADVNSTAGTLGAEPTVDNAGGAVDGRFTIVINGFTSLSSIDLSVYEEGIGLVHDDSDFDSTLEDLAPDNGGHPYFTIAAGSFGGTFAANDTITFRTTPYILGTTAYDNIDGGEIKLGTLQAPAYIRMEAVYTYPNKSRELVIIFPRAQATSSLEISFQAEDAAVPPLTISAKTADSETAGGHANWDDKPLGRIYWRTV